MSVPAIRVEQLSKAYEIGRRRSGSLRDTLADAWQRLWRRNGRGETFWALHNVAFEVPQGEILGIIGDNGAGKSTLLKILSRITPPTSGRAVLEGRVASLLEIGTGFHNELTGRENIFLNGAILGMTQAEIRKKFDEIVTFSGIEPFLDTPVKHYSSGMFVRLAFAVAAHLEAEILLVDEVLAVGDIEFQKKCLGKMDEVANSGRTVLFVSHDLNKIGSLCNRLIWLERGKIRMTGSPGDVIERYRDAALQRKEAGGAFIKKIGLSSRGSTEPIIGHGDPLTVEVEIDAPFPLDRPRLGMVIRDSYFTPIIGINNYLYNQQVLTNTPFQKGVIQMELPEVPLLSGEYSIDLFIGDIREDYEILKNAVYFQVRSDMQNGPMEKLDRELSKMYIEGIQWSLKEQ